MIHSAITVNDMFIEDILIYFFQSEDGQTLRMYPRTHVKIMVNTERNWGVGKVDQ